MSTSQRRPARHYPRLWLRTPLGAGPTGLSPASSLRRPAHTTTPSDSLSAARHFPGAPVIDRPAPESPQDQGRGGPLQFPRHPSARSTSPTPEGSSAPAPGSQAPSMAFAKSTQARHPLFPAEAGAFTTLQTSLHAADRTVALPRFDPGLSTGPGGLATGDPGVSPGWTPTSWMP